MKQSKPTTADIAYRWALTEMGSPVEISRAQRGVRYYCPLCNGPMIARLGDQLQHHFGHEEETGCSPEAVTRAALRRWISIQARDALAKRAVAKVMWHCSKCGKDHGADPLAGVFAVHEGYLWDAAHYADVALVD